MSISFSFAGTVLSQASNAILAFWLQKSNQLFFASAQVEGLSLGV